MRLFKSFRSAGDTKPDISGTNETPEDVINDVVWRNDGRYRFYETIAKYVPASGTIAMGLLISNSYLQTGRLDLLLGGACLSLLGAGIVDINAGKNYLSKAFTKAVRFVSRTKAEISQSEALAVTGIAACAFLGGGEMLNVLQNYPGDLISDFKDGSFWDYFDETASSHKVYANATWLLAASGLDVPAIRKQVGKVLDQDNIVNAQNMLVLLGSVMIGSFAAEANLPEFILMAGAQGAAASAGCLGWLGSKMAPGSFMPLEMMSDRQKSDAMQRYNEATADDPDADDFYTAYRKEWKRMLVARGHVKAEEVDSLGERYAQKIGARL